VKLVILEFECYALFWSKKYQNEILESKHPLITYWYDLKRAMRKRFMPFT